MDDSLHYYYIAMECFEAGNLDEAIVNFEKSFIIEPHYKTCERLAICFKITKQIDSYKKYTELAYIYNPKSDKTAVEYSQMLIDFGQINEAKKVLYLILSRNPSYGPARKLINMIDNPQK